MSLFSKLFGGGAAKSKPEAQAEDYKGFLITPQPIRDSGGFRIGARIEKEINGTLKTHEMIRADTIQSEEEARSVSLSKAQVFIDQMGEAIFD